MSSNLPAPRAPRMNINQAIIAWLNAKEGRTQSAKTRRAYEDTITHFRAALAAASEGLDLDGEPGMIRLAAQGWAAQRWTADIQDAGGVPVSNATFNNRLAIISSFYEYARRQEVLEVNPLEIAERRPVQAYAKVRALDPEDVAARLAKISKRDRQGLRDFVLLSIALTTGRRVSELAGLRTGHIRYFSKKMEITWVRCKGGKVMYDEIEGALYSAFLKYLDMVYGTHENLPADAPVWVAMCRNTKSRGKAISTDAIADIMEKHLGTSKVHDARHTFAHEMIKAGASIKVLQGHLGHEHSSTTDIYAGQMTGSANPFAAELAKTFGIVTEEGSEK